MAEAQGGDRGAFGRLVEHYGGQLVFALQGRMTDREDAFDMAQEAWVRVARGLAGFRVGQRFRPWLFAVAFNALRDHRRRQGTRPEAGNEHGAQGLATWAVEDRALQSLEEGEVIRMALAEVDEPYQSTLRLVDVLGLDHVEAASVLDCAPGTVKSRLSRGRRAFRASYERLVGEPAGEGMSQRELAVENSADETPQVMP